MTDHLERAQQALLDINAAAGRLMGMPRRNIVERFNDQMTIVNSLAVLNLAVEVAYRQPPESSS